ncbi:hypothetical protein F1737_06465 [Methanoplanus sp. FWC-SCC4]|uniref:UvrD-like helicase C-terminal domain-containing protein n=1 Tax=Methanochimaera problematica TaxID=2609417 RepID=A0AA97FCD7_9EURY|nr:ATP-binding domain-containing protein [Methanoplanus sp. FWC-SCC4]WOF16374.1 hypothetical protein F1737_06465 [Methanoplanus sp. FWC-SCC4]
MIDSKICTNQDKCGGQLIGDLISSRLESINPGFGDNAKVMELPNGPEIIRGIAGSGKTESICQRAAYLHSIEPEWRIGVFFSNPSLKGRMVSLLKKYTSVCGVEWDSEDPDGNLVAAELWGDNDNFGFYSEVCDYSGIKPMTVSECRRFENDPADCFGYACKKILENEIIDPLYDVIFIDGAEDILVSKNELLYEGKQPVFWLLHESLSSFDSENPERKRLVWSFDEYQSVFSQKVPTVSQIYGQDDLLKDEVNGFSELSIMDISFRTPGNILMAAHALGMGLYHYEGMLSGPTCKKAWKKMGYSVKGEFSPGNEITLSRKVDKTPNDIIDFCDESLINFRKFNSKQMEYAFLCESVIRNIEEDNVRPEDILIVSLKGDEAIKSIRSALNAKNITDCRVFTCCPDNDDSEDDHSVKPSGITISDVESAKGNEGMVVYLTDLEVVAKYDSRIELRNKLYIGMTRSKGWLTITGTPFYDELTFFNEVKRVLDDIKNQKEIKYRYIKHPRRPLDHFV